MMGDTPESHAARVVAFYLPQFHPIPENNAWWGPGFTEWTNAAKARPLFGGHHQPHIPADLGFYDLRLPETRAAQAAMAQRYGIEAFCYYHYWFAGKRLLERPFQEVLKSGRPDFPFCLCWANASWTGIWHGDPDRVLIEQTYPGESDYRAHFDALLPALRDRRYLTVDGKPLFMIYKPKDLPDASGTASLLRHLAERAGLRGLFLVGVNHNDNWTPEQPGFDAVVAQHLPGLSGHVPWRYALTKLRAKRRRKRLTVRDYSELMKGFIPDKTRQVNCFPCLVPGWDNTPRSGMNGLVLENCTPELFAQTVRRALHNVATKPAQHRLVFLKSWNEWAEGNHMEPDTRFGHAFLEALACELHPTSVDHDAHAQSSPEMLPQ